MKVTLTKNVLIKGSVFGVGSVVELNDNEAQSFIARGIAQKDNLKEETSIDELIEAIPPQKTSKKKSR
jgi:hypothetical protein